MKKMILAFVAMVVTTMSANAQSNNREITFDRISGYLELTTEQVEPVRTAFAQFMESQKSVQNVQGSEQAEGWGKVIERHLDTMKKVLTEKQYQKYDTLLNQSILNAADRYQEQQGKPSASPSLPAPSASGLKHILQHTFLKNFTPFATDSEGAPGGCRKIVLVSQAS